MLIPLRLSSSSPSASMLHCIVSTAAKATTTPTNDQTAAVSTLASHNGTAAASRPAPPSCHECGKTIPQPTECMKCKLKKLELTDEVKADMWLHDGSEHSMFRYKVECIARLKELDRRLLDLKVCTSATQL